MARWQIAGTGTLEALRIPLVEGRGFASSDAENSTGVVIVSRTMAQKFWGGRSPIGQRIRFTGFEPGEYWLTVIAVAGDVRQSGLTRPAPPVAYVSYPQLHVPAYLSSGTVVLRAGTEVKILTPAIRTLIRRIHAEAAVTFATLDEILASATARQKFGIAILSGFAVLAVVLALSGLYGTMSYLVTSQRRAIGTRLALGARAVDVVHLIAVRSLIICTLGSAAGALCCIASRNVLRTIVPDLAPSDSAVLAAAVTLMFMTSVAACWAPARQALRIDAAEVLRSE